MRIMDCEKIMERLPLGDQSATQILLILSSLLLPVECLIFVKLVLIGNYL